MIQNIRIIYYLVAILFAAVIVLSISTYSLWSELKSEQRSNNEMYDRFNNVDRILRNHYPMEKYNSSSDSSSMQN